MAGDVTTHLVDRGDVVSVPGVTALRVSHQSLQQGAVLCLSEPRIRSEQDVSPSLKLNVEHVGRNAGPEGE